MLPRHKRQKRGDRIFKAWVLPILKKDYPGVWQSTSGTHLDYKYCIDWYYTSPTGTPLQIASRSWMSRPQQHFSARYIRSSTPKIKLETGIMLHNLKKNKSFPNLTIEAFIYNGWVYIAIIDSKVLWNTVQRIIDGELALKTFNITDPVGYTSFIKIPYDYLPVQPSKIIHRVENWES